MEEFRVLSAEIFSTAQQLQSKRLLPESSTLCGVPEGIRTPDPRIKSPLLYRLSYEHIELYNLYYRQHLNKPTRKSGKPNQNNKKRKRPCSVTMLHGRFRKEIHEKDLEESYIDLSPTVWARKRTRTTNLHANVVISIATRCGVEQLAQVPQLFTTHAI